MELWGTSYLLQDSRPVGLIGVIGATTSPAGAGYIQLSFSQTPGVFFVSQSDRRWTIVMTWELALKFSPLLHVLVLQSRILRRETAELRRPAGPLSVFTIVVGVRSGPVELSWEDEAGSVRCGRVDGSTEQFELVLTEEAAAEFAVGLPFRAAEMGLQGV